MSKTLILKAVNLLLEENKDKSQKDSIKSSSKKDKRKKNPKTSHDVVSYAPIDRTSENLEVLKKLKQLRPKSSVAQKVIPFYTKQDSFGDDATKAEPQRSILFDDDDDSHEIVKRKKKRRKQQAEDDS